MYGSLLDFEVQFMHSFPSWCVKAYGKISWLIISNMDFKKMMLSFAFCFMILPHLLRFSQILEYKIICGRLVHEMSGFLTVEQSFLNTFFLHTFYFLQSGLQLILCYFRGFLPLIKRRVGRKYFILFTNQASSSYKLWNVAGPKLLPALNKQHLFLCLVPANYYDHNNPHSTRLHVQAT